LVKLDKILKSLQRATPVSSHDVSMPRIIN